MEHSWYFGWYPTTTWGWAFSILTPLAIIAFFAVRNHFDR